MRGTSPPMSASCELKLEVIAIVCAWIYYADAPACQVSCAHRQSAHVCCPVCMLINSRNPVAEGVIDKLCIG